MHITDIHNELREFVTTNFLFGQDGDLDPHESLVQKGVIDSTGVLELIAYLEERYGIKVGDDEVTPDNLDSLYNICEFTNRKLAKSA